MNAAISETINKLVFNHSSEDNKNIYVYSENNLKNNL